jgi:sigma-B regulation protein RsbU (phosphoserine phosphatase)
MIKILCIDDDQNITDVVSRYLTKWGYRVHVASDGETGWKLIQEEKPEIVLTDWMMPGIDGPELCRRVRNTGFTDYVYMILLTAKDEKEDLILGMNAGADDFISKPFDFRELKVRLNAAARLIRLERQRLRMAAALDDQNQKLNELYDTVTEDLEAAARIQRTLLPEKKSFIPGYNFDWLFTPSTFISGDVFNIFPIDTMHLNFYLIDVSGHGIPAALLSTTLSRILSPNSHKYSLGPLGQFKCYTCPNRENPMVSLNSPASIALELNRQFISDDETMQYFTMVYGSVNLQDNIVTITQAGHPHPFLHKADGSIQTLWGGGFPIGLIPDADFTEASLPFEPGDRLFLYSDGLSECHSQNGETFGSHAIEEIIRAGKGLPLKEITDQLRRALAAHRGSELFEDDISFLAIERCAEHK